MTNSADPDQKPTDLNLHCLLRQGMSCSARGGLRIRTYQNAASDQNYPVTDDTTVFFLTYQRVVIYTVYLLKF